MITVGIGIIALNTNNTPINLPLGGITLPRLLSARGGTGDTITTKAVAALLPLARAGFPSVFPPSPDLFPKLPARDRSPAAP